MIGSFLLGKRSLSSETVQKHQRPRIGIVWGHDFFFGRLIQGTPRAGRKNISATV